MASTVYSSSYLSNAVGLNTAPELSVSGGGGAQEIIDSIIATLYLSTSAYSVTYSVTVQVNFTGGSVQYTRNVKFDSGNYTGDNFTFTLPAMTAEQCNAIQSITLQCSDSRIFAKRTQSVTVNYTVTTACGAPTAVSVDNPTPAPGGTVTLFWSGAAAGTNNAITRYDIYRADAAGGPWQYLTSATGGSVGGLSIPGANGASYFFKVLTVGMHGGYDSALSQAYAQVTTTAGVCGAPTVSLSAVLAETDPTLTWSGASSGVGNSLTGYELQYAESPDGSSWGDWAALQTISSTATGGSVSVPISPTRGSSRRYRIRTLGSLGTAYASAWVATPAVRRNNVPAAPASVTAAPGVYESGGVTVAWSPAADADGNLVRYHVQWCLSTDGATWTGWSDQGDYTATSYVDLPGIPRGSLEKWRVCGIDAFGITGAYTESNSVRMNALPFAPAIHYPVAGKVTCNPRPRFLAAVAFEPDGQEQTLTASGYTASSSGTFPQGKRLLFRRDTAAAEGNVQITLQPVDSLGAAGDVTTRSIRYQAPVWMDSLETGTTRIRAVHVNELRAVVDVMRDAYGLPAYPWNETIQPHSTSLAHWAEHMTELRAAIEEIAAFVNAWDSSAATGKITLPAWIAIRGKQPQADVMAQLRTVVTTL